MPGRGFEPLRISPPDPKSGASANFATLAIGFSDFRFAICDCKERRFPTRPVTLETASFKMIAAMLLARLRLAAQRAPQVLPKLWQLSFSRRLRLRRRVLHRLQPRLSDKCRDNTRSTSPNPLCARADG